jgi:hypothetical protein
MGMKSCAALLLVVLGIAGCGGGSSGSTQGATQAPAQSSAQEEPQGGEASIEEFGEEAEGAERSEVLATFTGYLNALTHKDYATACAYLSHDVHESLDRFAGKGPGAECASLLPALLSPTASQVARGQAEGTVRKVRVEGERGFVVFKAPGAKLYEMTMVREGGEWKVATVAASVLVPEL